jgi:16S rRNA processing protein RimM
LGNDEYYVDDLMGFAVVDPSGEHLGTIRDVVSSPAHDILDIDGVLVPAVNQFILEIDMDRKQIVLQPIPGLFDEGEA